MEIVHKEPRTKLRKITIHKNLIFREIDRLSFRLADTAAEDVLKDKISTDTEDALDGSILNSLLEQREATIRQKLSFALQDEEITELDNSNTMNGDFVYNVVLPESFPDKQLPMMAKSLNDYLVKGTLLDWYTSIGTSFGANLIAEVTQLESRVVDIIRKPSFVRHPSVVYFNPHKSR